MSIMPTSLANMPAAVVAKVSKLAVALLPQSPALLPLSPAGPDAYIALPEMGSSDLTEVLHEGPVIENGFARLLDLELKPKSVDASDWRGMAEQLTDTIQRNVGALSNALNPDQRKMIDTIAADSGISKKMALIEYLASASLIRILRDYHDLPARDVFRSDDHDGGFIALTKNGSMVSSGPHVGSPQDRVFHYIRMPSRTNVLLSEAETRWGELKEDIHIGERLRSTAFTTSNIAMLLYVTPDKANEFEYLREWAEMSVGSVHHTISHGVLPVDLKR